jgi:hypothetical protein
MKLSEVVQAFSDYMGLGTNVNGATLGTLVGNKYGYNNDSPGNTTMTWVGLDDLYIHAGIFETYYRSNWSFFDYLGDTAHSFYKCASALDVLKKICQSIGYLCRVTVDGSGNRQLSVVPMTSSSSAVTYASNASILKDARLEPYARSIAGAQCTVSSGTDVIRGSGGSKTVNIDCMFSSCNAVRTRTTFIAGVRGLDLGPDILTALYSSPDTPTGTRGATPGSGLTVATMYSICAIALYDGTSGVPNTAMIDPWGAYVSAAPFALNTVMYPSASDPYAAWTEVPGMALAHILYSEKLGTDDISVFRSKGQQLTIRVKGITATTYYPGDTVTLTIAAVTNTWTVRSYRENRKDNTMEFVLELFA